MLRHERRIAAGRATVWEIVSRLDEWDELLPTIDDVTRLGPAGPIAVGTRFAVRQPGLVPAEYTVTDWRPDEGFTWESTKLGLHTVATHTLHTDGQGTVLRLGIGWSGPMAWLVRLLVGRKGRSYLEQEAAAFAEHAERASR